MTWLTDDPISTDALIADVLRDSDGAVVLFSGVVRNHHEGKRVESIFYDAYRPMAEKEIEKIVNGIRAEFPDVKIALLHRLGQLGVGDASIVIACASPHRAEAFAASRAAIDRIKETVPIWKRERGPDGEEWVGWQGRC
ncbi:MAG: molybdenum cofactor biosynthesis protein MoaE [Thermoanaerobaculia bacterium]